MKIKQSEHVFIAGRTGSGKTFLAETYLAGFDNVIALDTKGFISWKQSGEVPIFTRLKDLQNFEKGKAIYRPDVSEMNKEFYEAFFRWIYDRQNTTVYIDELMSVTSNAMYIPESLKAIYTRGRQRNTSCWALSQRPYTIPLVAMSEATHFFIFDLQMKSDRKRIMEIVPSEKILLSPSEYAKFYNIKQDYLFWYYNFKIDEPILTKLKV